jgi:acylphosphatase
VQAVPFILVHAFTPRISKTECADTICIVVFGLCRWILVLPTVRDINIPRVYIMLTRVHLTVSGSVQGVGFRYFSLRTAMELNLTGYARNLINGDVEIEAQGAAAAVEVFIKRIHEGPRNGHVQRVQREEREVEGLVAVFEIL